MGSRTDRLKAVAVVAGIVATALGVASDGFGLIERFRDTTAPTGDIAVVRVQEHATFAEWIAELRTSEQPEAQRVAGDRYTPAELDVIGTMVALRVGLSDARGERVRLLWTLLEPRSPRPADGPGFHDQEATVFEPDAVLRTGIVTVWVRPPPRDGRYALRFELWDDAGVQLASVETPLYSAIGSEGF